MTGQVPSDPLARDFVARNRLRHRLDAAVAAYPRARSAPTMVVDLDAFDANAADLAKRASGTPLRVATKSLRVPALVIHGRDDNVARHPAHTCGPASPQP